MFYKQAVIPHLTQLTFSDEKFYPFPFIYLGVVDGLWTRGCGGGSGVEVGEKGLIAILCDFLIQPHGVLFPPNRKKKFAEILLFS